MQLLVVKDCPHEGPAAAILRQALDDVGLTDVPFTTRVVVDQTQAEALAFLGSPTILIDGRDPFAEPTQAPGLACRLYPGLSGVPPLTPLRQALRQAADHG